MGMVFYRLMRFAASISDHHDPVAATKAAVQQVAAQLAGEPCHLALLFASALYRADWAGMLRHIRQTLGTPLVLGCTGGGILGIDQELEAIPALSLAAAHLPGVELHPFTVRVEDLQQEPAAGFWMDKLGLTPAQEPVTILLPEPSSCDVVGLLATLGAVYPRMPIIGGLASGASGAEASGPALFLNDQTLTEGAVGVALTGNIVLHTIVAQGCRPIGRPFIVTKAQERFILELAGMPATEALRDLFMKLPAEDQALAQRALFLGVVMNEQQPEFRRGDFLIRNLMGIDPSTGAIAAGDHIHVGQTVQFQVRDADTSREDLQHLLQEYSHGSQSSSPTPSSGALLFSCLGRGQDLYGQPHHDIRAIRAALGSIPIAGFFCNGEIGPVGGRNFVHGFTSSLGLFRPKHGP